MEPNTRPTRLRPSVDPYDASCTSDLVLCDEALALFGPEIRSAVAQTKGFSCGLVCGGVRRWLSFAIYPEHGCIATMKGGGLMTTSPAPHAGRLVVITGVTKGLGRALALEMATRGHVVAGCGRNEELLASLRSQIGSKHLLKVVDVALDDNVNEFAKVVLETHGVPDIIVNNAGIINKNAKLWEIPKEEFDAVIDTNVKGTANCIRHFGKHMIQRGQGVIVNVSSGWGRAGAAEVSAYCTSKWAVEGLTRSLAKELPKGMAAVALSPGVLNTELLTSCFGASAALYPSPESWAPQAAEMILGFGVADNGTSQTV